MDTHGFEVNLFENLTRLRDALWDGYYYPSRGTVHVIFDPVQREIFAAPYIDRILHIKRDILYDRVIEGLDKQFGANQYDIHKPHGL